MNLGVINANPSSTMGVIQIMKELKKHVPLDDGNVPFSILCNWDELSVERMIDARCAIADHEVVSDRLSGLEPSPQEFHKRCINLQVSFKS